MSYLITAFASALVALPVGYLIGHRFGYDKGNLDGQNYGFKLGKDVGKDEQWIDDQIAKYQKDRARRDAQGRFKS